MRRTKIITNKILIFLILAALSNIFSFGLDQQVIQQEDKIRNKSIERRQEKTQIENINYALSTVNNLRHDILLQYHHLLENLRFTNKAVQAFNPNLASEHFLYKFNQEDLKSLNEFYKKNYIKIINNYNDKIIQFQKIYKYILKQENLSENFEGDSWRVDETISSSFSKLNNEKISPDILNEYNFNKKLDEKSINKNIEISDEILWKIVDLYNLTFDLLSVSKRLHIKYTEAFTTYHETLDDYAYKKQRKNYFILFSITFQILSVVFFLLLFKEILTRNKKKV